MKNITYEVKFKSVNDTMVNYEVTINGRRFKFFTGLGWIKFTKTKDIDHHVINFQMLDTSTQHAIQKAAGKKTYADRKFVYAQKPSIETVLESLFLESHNVHNSFEEWCMEYDYSTDSIKARKTYEECVENYFKLKKALGDDYETIKKQMNKAGSIDG